MTAEIYTVITVTYEFVCQVCFYLWLSLSKGELSATLWQPEVLTSYDNFNYINVEHHIIF